MDVEKKPLWFTTGNPFVDTGQEMMAALAGVDDLTELTKADVEQLAKRIGSLYTQRAWLSRFHTIFPMSKLANPSVKNPSEQYSALLSKWLELWDSGNSLPVTCAVSGTSAHLYLSKMYLPMSDSVGYNFQSANQSGTPVSIPVALALQFFPLALTKVGRTWAFPHFSNFIAQATWADSIARSVEFSEGVGNTPVREINTSRQINAFFRIIERLVRSQKEYPKSGVTLYLFNNFNKTDRDVTKTDLHYMPADVFGFIQRAENHNGGRDWHRIVWSGYQTRQKIEDEDDALRRFNNSVYQRLLDGQSISRYFVNQRKRCPVVRGTSGWILFSYYLKEVRGMDQTRIENLKVLGDRIAPIIRNRKSRLLTLESANSRGKLTDVLYRIATKDSAGKLNEPLITFDQLVSDLFPHDMQYSDWREVKYLLLFRIYEQLFDDLKDNREYTTANVEDETSDDEGGEQE